VNLAVGWVFLPYAPLPAAVVFGVGWFALVLMVWRQP